MAQPKRILVIDDDGQIREMLRRMLEYAGYEVVDAADGRIGVTLFEQQHVDLVITDILMPNQEGLETIMRLRRLQPGIRIIAVSGGGVSGALDFLSTAGKLGANATVSKPFSREQILATVEQVLAGEATA